MKKKTKKKIINFFKGVGTLFSEMCLGSFLLIKSLIPVFVFGIFFIVSGIDTRENLLSVMLFLLILFGWFFDLFEFKIKQRD